MRNKYIVSYLLGSAFVLTSLSSCYDDESTLATNKIDDITISTDDDASTLYVSYLDELDVKPTIKRGTEQNVDGLAFKWEISELPNDKNPEWIELSDEQDLHTVINNAVSTMPYYLRYTVTDTKHGDLQSSKLWKVVVQSSFLDGIVVSDTKDGSSSDLNLIMSKNLTVNYSNREDKVVTQILEKANHKPFDQLMTKLTYNSQGHLNLTHENTLWAVTDEGDAVLFNTKDYSKTSQLSEGGVVTYKPDGLKVTDIYTTNAQWLIMNTNQKLYSVNSTSVSNFGWYDAGGSLYPINNGVVALASSANVGSQMIIWYDAEDGCFVYGDNGGRSISYANDLASNTFFDPVDSPNLSAIAAGQTSGTETPAFVMKDNVTGNYAIYTFTRYQEGEYEYDDDWNIIGTITPEVPASAKMRYEIPEAGKALLDKAVSVFFAVDQSILYVATANGIYSINFAGSTAIVNDIPVYTPSAGETIAKAKLYCQGAYMHDYSVVGKVEDGATVEELPLNKKAVIVATQSDTYEGKISVVPMTQIGTGKLDATSALTYSGFGKILDFCTTAY